MAHKITTTIGQDYQSATFRLTVALGIFTFSAFHEYVASLFVRTGDTFIDYGVHLWPFAVAGFCFVWAGHAFRRLEYGHPDEASAGLVATDRDYLESVTALADLVSRPGDIDQALDEVRKITATLEPGTKLTIEERHKLTAVYTYIETYLMHKDPLRSFTREELLRRVRPAFRTLVEQR